MRGIGKSFPGVRALDDVDIDVLAGEILGLVGENGAGKSTLMKILAGAYSRDEGEVTVAGEAVGDADPHEMMQRGVAVIYQEPALADHITTAENIFMGRLPTNRLGLVDWKRLVADTEQLSRRLGLALEPRVPVGRLSVARRWASATASRGSSGRLPARATRTAWPSSTSAIRASTTGTWYAISATSRPPAPGDSSSPTPASRRC